MGRTKRDVVLSSGNAVDIQPILDPIAEGIVVDDFIVVEEVKEEKEGE